MVSRFLLLSGFLLAFSSCKQEKITPTKSPNYFESYRLYLWSTLEQNQWHVDFVGTRYDDFEYPGSLNTTFDRNHEGVSGSVSRDVYHNLDIVMLLTGLPDVVLLGIGGNDLANGRTVNQTANTINNIIDKIQLYNPNATIFVEQIAPPRRGSFDQQLMNKVRNLNAAIAVLAQLQTDQSSRVIAVDMYTDWQDSYLSDNIHYSVIGAKEVAERYYEQMRHNLHPLLPYRILTLGDSRVEGRREKRHTGL